MLAVRFSVPLAVGCAVALVAAAPVVSARTRPAISMAQARTIAQRASPGKIVGSELEREKGGSGLRYSFDIKSGKVTREVGIDAITGKVLENAVEGKHPD